MSRSDKSIKQTVVEKTKETGVLPCIRFREKKDFIAYAQAMYDGGARIIEVPLATPSASFAIEAIETISTHFKNKLLVGAGTVLDPIAAREVILHGGTLIVSPCIVQDVIDVADRYQIPVYCGAFTPTECFQAMKAGASMVKIFPGGLGGPKYLTNIKMVFPNVDLIPSGNVTLENATEFIKCGACAVSGARSFMNFEKIEKEGLSWLTKQVAKFIEIVKKAKSDLPDLP